MIWMVGNSVLTSACFSVRGTLDGAGLSEVEAVFKACEEVPFDFFPRPLLPFATASVSLELALVLRAVIPC